MLKNAQDASKKQLFEVIKNIRTKCRVLKVAKNISQFFKRCIQATTVQRYPEIALNILLNFPKGITNTQSVLLIKNKLFVTQVSRITRLTTNM
jgi:hypothetical protein